MAPLRIRSISDQIKRPKKCRFDECGTETVDTGNYGGGNVVKGIKRATWHFETERFIKVSQRLIL